MVSMNYRVDHVNRNKYSRPGLRLFSVLGIVIHYTANPKASAQNHKSFFDGSDGGGSRYAGAHIFVDKHEAVEIVPLNEVAYHANEKYPRLSFVQGNANFTTIGVEMCIEADGSFHPDTVERTVQVVKKLQAMFPLTRDTRSRVVRHYDVTGKLCPKPYVQNPIAWTLFLSKVDAKPVTENKKEGITVAEFKEQLKKELAEMREEGVSDWARKDWEEAQLNGYFDGKAPQALITRQEVAVVINRLRDNFKTYIKKTVETEVAKHIEDKHAE